MARKRFDTDAENLKRAKELIARRLAEGRGQSRGQDYVPWLKVRDVPSEGLSTRVKGWKSRRVHHFHSSVELKYFYCLEYADDVIEVREQYPLLPIEETLAIADQAGIKHPFDHKKQMPAVMTTDFLITAGAGTNPTDYARTIKPSTKLADRRVLEKFEVERRYWQRRGVSWGIATEREVPVALAKNVFWMHLAHDLADCGVTHNELQRVEKVLRPLLLPESDDYQRDSLSSVCAACDDRLGLTAGNALMAVRHLLARKIWRVDMLQIIEVGKPLRLQNANPEFLIGLK